MDYILNLILETTTVIMVASIPVVALVIGVGLVPKIIGYFIQDGISTW